MGIKRILSIIFGFIMAAMAASIGLLLVHNIF